MALLQDEEFLPAAKSLIANAGKSIYISSFKLEITTKKRGQQLGQLFDILAKKCYDKKVVRVLTNKRDNRGHVPDTNAYAIRYLKEKRVPVRYFPNGRLCHAKILIVDDRKAIIGSHNLSVKSCHNNFEVSFFITDLVTVKYLVDAYDRVWDTAKEV